MTFIRYSANIGSRDLCKQIYKVYFLSIRRVQYLSDDKTGIIIVIFELTAWTGSWKLNQEKFPVNFYQLFWKENVEQKTNIMKVIISILLKTFTKLLAIVLRTLI